MEFVKPNFFFFNLHGDKGILYVEDLGQRPTGKKWHRVLEDGSQVDKTEKQGAEESVQNENQKTWKDQVWKALKDRLRVSFNPSWRLDGRGAGLHFQADLKTSEPVWGRRSSRALMERQQATWQVPVSPIFFSGMCFSLFSIIINRPLLCDGSYQASLC